MVDTQAVQQTKIARWGWTVLLVASALFGLNGLGWIFFGPDASVANMADNMGLSVSDLDDMYPAAVDAIAQEARRVAVYLAAIGAMGLVAAFAGLRRGARWAWYATWVFIFTMLALVLVGLVGGLGAFGVGMLVLAVIALIGQLLARPVSI